MTGISFVLPTSGTNDTVLNEIIDSIELQNMSQYQIIIVGGAETTINRRNTIHIPFNENMTPFPWTTRKKNTGVMACKYDVVVMMHDYQVLDANWYSEFEKFGLDWDICVHQNLMFNPVNDEPKYVRANGWRVEYVPGYTEFPWAMRIPYDIDIFIPYMGIQGSYWCCKKSVIFNNFLNEDILWGQPPHEDAEWSTRVVPFWQGKDNGCRNKVVANPNCIVRNIKQKPGWPGNTDWDRVEKQFEPLWEAIRNGYRRPGVYHYERSLNQVVLSK